MQDSGRLYVSTDVDSLWSDMCETLEANGAVVTQDDAFWNEDYQTHWGIFSEKISDQKTMGLGFSIKFVIKNIK